jgi:hypothetical protein
MDSKFPRFPMKGEHVKFNHAFTFIPPIINLGGFMATGTTITMNNASQNQKTIPKGSIGQVLKTHIDDGYDHDCAAKYTLTIGIFLDNQLFMVKVEYNLRPDMLTVIPYSKAAKVLFGKKDEA